MSSSLVGEEWDFNQIGTPVPFYVAMVGCAFQLHTGSTCVAAGSPGLMSLAMSLRIRLHRIARSQIFMRPIVAPA